MLGSCVALTLHHSPSRLAAICHAMAPDCGEETVCAKKCAQMHRYVNCMIPAMVRSFLSRDIDPKDIDAKLFGGASMISVPGDRTVRNSVGAMNILAARKVTQNHGVLIRSANVGGSVGRKIIFNTRTGEVLLKHLRSLGAWRHDLLIDAARLSQMRHL